MGITSWSSIPMEAYWAWVAIIAICGCLWAVGVWSLVGALDKCRKRREVLVEATVGGKYICHPRGVPSEPVLLVSEKDHAAVRKNGKCELMVMVNCIGGFAFAEWVKPKFFDSVELGSKVVVTYAEDLRTQAKTCLSITKKK